MGYSFLLHSNDFTERGDSVTLLSLGSAISRRFAASIVIAFPEQSPRISEDRVKEALDRGFEVFRYRDKRELDEFAIRRSISHSYVFSGGSRASLPYYDPDNPASFRIGKSKHITHVVFRVFDPHGDAYTYVSDWLFSWAKKKLRRSLRWARRNQFTSDPLFFSFPHFVESWPSSSKDTSFRDEHGISDASVVIGRIGGFSEFSDPAARRGLIKILNGNKSAVALLVNTKRFTDHPRAIFLPALSRVDVKRFYDSCDVLLNGRRMGESFGYSIVEPLSLGKPVIAPHWIRNPLMDRHHLKVLSGLNLVYCSASHLSRIFDRIQKNRVPEEKLKALSTPFSEQVAMDTLERILSKI
jgi:glycosyltransferase involved in cell wall biosynthesis